ncbi:MAG TPA: CHASE domain-containing protein, partial [Blastocatellia bacterium]|nr:CHASE domain-containing protein [Blastocatellia bacterium]
YLEPQDRRNQAAIGYDMFSEPKRRAAMERARDWGIAAASGKVRLVQEIDENVQAGFLIYFPVYYRNRPIATEQERREALHGFIYSPFRADDLLEGILGNERHAEIGVRVFEGTEFTPDHLLHDSDRALFEDGSYRPRFTSTASVYVAGRVWSLSFYTRPQFEQASSRGAETYICLIGLIGSFVLFVATRSEARARIAAERIAAELSESEKERSQILTREQEARRQAESANRLKDEFLATVSHELRTPLNAILGWSHLLRAARLDEETKARAFDVIENNARSQAQIVDDLLDVSSIITGKLSIDVRRVRLESVIEAAIDAVHLAADAKLIRIEKTLDPGIGSVLGDPDRLRQVVWNLLSNAIKFTDEGGRVRVRLERVDGITGGSQAQITITDSGQGIKQEFLPYVFDRFSQGDSSMTRKHGGLGLGLALVRHLVEMHGGTVKADSPGEGKGTSITVRLPLAQTQAVSAESRYEDRSMVNTVSLNGLRVLVVDDESETREILSALLVRYGAEVETCGSASEAFEKLQMWSPAILLSDIAMPGEDGYALIGKVRSLEPERGGQVPAVALTALAGADDSKRAVSAGFHVHLPKPVDPFRLIKVITELTGTERKAS